MNDTDKQWEKWAVRDPYFSVLSIDSYRRRNLNQSFEGFFRTGEEFISEILKTLEHTVGRSINRNRALDFGCGVGRLVIPLAKRFEQVIGVDVSATMLKEAQKNCELYGVTNVTFQQSVSDLDLLGGSFDFINSYIVLQHIPRKRGYAIITHLLGLLAPDGGVMIHFSIRRRSSRLRRASYIVKHKVPFAYVVANIIRRRDWNEPLMQMNEYDLPMVLDIFARHGMKKVGLVLEAHGPVLTVRLFSSPLTDRTV